MVGFAVSMCLLAALALDVACQERSPSLQEPAAASPPSQQADTPARSTPATSPAPRDPQRSDSGVRAAAKPEHDAFHRVLSVASAGPVRPLSTKAFAAAVQRNNAASFALWSAFGETGNFVASPYSVRAALGLVYLASGGKSRERLKSRLVYPERADDLGARALDATVRAGAEVRFESASSIWISDGNRVQSAYLQAVADFLPGEVHAIDFNAEPERVRRFINAWASAHTRGDITEPFPESTLTSHTQPTLMDTAAFSGTWPPDFMSSVGKHAFSTFSVDGIVDALHVNMMYGGKCKAVFQGAVEAAIADYRDSSLSLVVVKPRSWRRFTWNEGTFSRIWAALQRAPEIAFDLPRFKLRSVRDLKQPLLRLGIALSEPSLLQGMVDRTGPTLYLDRVIHQASIQVDATPPKVELTPQELARRRAELDLGIPPYFSGDRAFYFLVVERGTGLILLMGQVIDPTVSAP